MKGGNSMTRKPRRQTYPLETYLKKMANESIRSDQDVQRLSGQWDNNMVNELMVTVLKDDYIPPIILGEEQREDTTQLWIIEGLQRSTSLSKFRYGNYKITSSVEDYMIEYQREVVDENGEVKRDAEGNIVRELIEFDVRNKTYNGLPEELKSRFDEYQIETVIHEECTVQEMSKLVRRYNNHKSMNASQRAFTYIENFARDIRNITGEHRFFKDFDNYSQKERDNGTLERIVTETAMAVFHLEHWQKQSKRMDAYLNEHATKEEFAVLKEYFDRLEAILDKKTADLFHSKNTFIWVALFAKFTELGEPDRRFAEFLRAFMEKLHAVEIDGESFDIIDANRCTKDKAVVKKKLVLLEKLMRQYFNGEPAVKSSIGKKQKASFVGEHSSKPHIEKTEIENFVSEVVNADVREEDMELYREVFEDLTLNVDNSSKLLEEQNLPSFLAIVAYSFEKELDLDQWIVDFFGRNRHYRKNQRENYLYMREDVEKYFQEGG